MTREELRNQLRDGKTLNDLFAFTNGQECIIYKYKAEVFLSGNQIIYIPDVFLNGILLDCPITDPEEIEDVLSKCYTGQDFIDECEGDVMKAMRLFWYCDWQHPSSAVEELDDDDEELPTIPDTNNLERIILDILISIAHRLKTLEPSSIDYPIAIEELSDCTFLLEHGCDSESVEKIIASTTNRELYDLLTSQKHSEYLQKREVKNEK